eukprot:PhF_6_TR10635/c0_g2_i1/m.17228
MPTKSTYVEDWKRSKHVIEYLCYCRNRWWGGRRNNRCRECDKIAFPCPFKLQKGVAWFDCLHCGRTFTSYANGKKKFFVSVLQRYMWGKSSSGILHSQGKHTREEKVKALSQLLRLRR